jgi:hypothetical protein
MIRESKESEDEKVDAMEGIEESKETSDLEGTEEGKKDRVVLPSFKKCNDILYHSKPANGFFACFVVLLRDLFNFLIGFFFLCGSYTSHSSSRLETRMRREMMNCSDIADQEGNEQFLVSHGVDAYTRQDEQGFARLQVPAPMKFSNEKLIGPPAPRKSGCIGNQMTRSESFGNKNFEEPLRHTLILHRNRNPNSVHSPIPITESLARQSVLYDELPINDDHEKVETDFIKYEDVVRESHNIDPFGWLK